MRVRASKSKKTHRSTEKVLPQSKSLSHAIATGYFSLRTLILSEMPSCSGFPQWIEWERVSASKVRTTSSYPSLVPSARVTGRLKKESR